MTAPTDDRVAPSDEQIVAAALRFYADQMPAYAAAAGLTQEEYAAVMVDVRHAKRLSDTWTIRAAIGPEEGSA